MSLNSAARGFTLSRAQTLVAALSLVVVGMLLLFWGVHLKGTGSAVLAGLGSATLSIGAVTLVSDLYIRPAFTRDLLDMVQLEQRLHSIGLKDFRPDSQFDWKYIYGGAKTIRALVMKPEPWMSRDWNLILQSARTQKVVVDVYLPDADNAQHVSALLGEDLAAYSAAVKAAVDRMSHQWRKGKEAVGSGQIHVASSLSIHYLGETPSYSLVQTSDQAVLLLQPLLPSGGSSEPVVLHFSVSDRDFPASWLSDRWGDIAKAVQAPPVFTDRAPTRGLSVLGEAVTEQ